MRSPWRLSHRFDPEVVPMADRHYNRQTPGSPQFVPPGRCLVLKRPGAFWVTSWQREDLAKHEWAGAWVCSAFRRESGPRASELIVAAVQATLWRWPSGPDRHGMVTFVDPSAIRHKRDPGRCFRRAGFRPVGWTRRRHRLALLLPTEEIFALGELAPLGAQLSFAESRRVPASAGR